MEIQQAKEISTFIGTAIAGVYVGYKFIIESRRHREITKNQSSRNEKANLQTELLLQVSNRLESLIASTEMSNGFKTQDRVARIKHIAYGDQKNYWLKEIIALYRRNGIKNKEATISNIKDVVSKVISNTDSFLRECIPDSYIASISKKIEFVCDSDLPDVTYSIFLEAKDDESILYSKLSGVYDKGLGLVRKEFYGDNGKVKKLEG